MQNKQVRTLKPAKVQVYGTFLGITLGKANSGMDFGHPGTVGIPQTS